MNLKAERLNRGLSLNAAATAMGVKPHVLRDAENLGTRPYPENGKLIADFYGVLVTDLWPVEEQSAA